MAYGMFRQNVWTALRAVLLLSIGSALAAPGDGPAEPRPGQLVGRWDLTVHGPGGDSPSWLEVRRSGHSTLVGSFVSRVGSARPVARVEWDKGHFHFALPPQWEHRTDDQAFDGRLERDQIRGETTGANGSRIPWDGRRAPALKREQTPRWGEPVELFNGRDLTGWKPRESGIKNGWVARDGMLVNAEPGNDLLTDRRFTDFKLRAEFRYPKGSNSGIYLRGRYEVQIEDNYGEEPDNEKIGGVYGFLTPSVNAARKPGEWQAMEITLVGRAVTVEFNGERVIDRQTIPGITGGALDSDEAEPGPVMLQGDHGPIEFRKLTVTPAEVGTGSNAKLPE